MSSYSLESFQEAVRYKNRKNEGEGEQDEEVLISPSLEENQSSKGERSFPQLKIKFYTISTFIIVLITFFIFGVLYYHTSIFRGSQKGSCTPLQHVEEVIVLSEKTHFPSCTDNKMCHSFLDFIEKKHEGSKYNFVIGQRGELYIGAGFKCLINSGKNTMYVKLLRSEQLEPFYENSKMCFRLSEIIDHGISCEKILPNFKIQDEKKTCGVLESNMNRSYHVHDPNHGAKLIHSEFGWSFCGNFSSTKNMKHDKVITLESLPTNPCSPLHLVDKVIVDIEEHHGPLCEGHLQCLQEYEKHHEGFKYNFIIGYNLDIYVGLGFKCRANSTSGNNLKIKVLGGTRSWFVYFEQSMKYVMILKQGLACGKISENCSIEVSCNITNTQYIECGEYSYRYGSSKNMDIIKMQVKEYPVETFFDSYHPPLEGDRYIVPSINNTHWLCHKKHLNNDSTTSTPEPIHTSTDRPIIASDTSCIRFKKVDKVRLITEEISYSCLNNVTCRSLLDTIEEEHDGLKYNFVIGPEGELYIGAGFKCMANSEENVLHVKLLVNEGTSLETFNTKSKNSSLNAVCSRLSEIIEHGILCEKISQDYDTVNEFSSSYNTSVVSNAKATKLTDLPHHQTCLLGDELYMNRSNHLHDPDYKMRTLIPKNSKWTFCGDFSNKTNIEEYGEPKKNISGASCSPLKSINKITVTAVSDTDSTSTCTTWSEALDYNLLLDDDQKMCPVSHNWCKAENATGANSLIIGMVPNQLREVCEDFWTLSHNRLFLHILEEGLACGKFVKENIISIKLNCHKFPHPFNSNSSWILQITEYYMLFCKDDIGRYRPTDGCLRRATFTAKEERDFKWKWPAMRRQACPEETLDILDSKDEEDEIYVDPEYY